MDPLLTTRLQAAILQVPLHLIQLSESTLQHRPAPNKWSKKEIFGHLIDSARVNLQRYLEANYAVDKYVVQRYAQNELVRVNDYQNQPIGELIQLWRATNQQILRVFQNIKNLPAEEAGEKLDMRVEIPHEGKSETLGYIMQDYVDHLEHHLKQIFGDLSFLQKEEKRNVSVVEAMQQLKKEKLFATVLEHGTMSVEIYEPNKEDNQLPHDQDELYVVISGSGGFYNNGITKPFQAGDVLFVPAGVEHRFLNFTDDFKTWVIFYGKKGGEVSANKFYEIKKEIGGKEYLISTDSNKIDTEAAHAFITNSYWAKGRSLEMMQKGIDNSLTFGVFHQGKQIGLARVISDFMKMAYLSDVYILEVYQGKGLGKWLMETIMDYDELSTIKKFILHTADAHGLYEQFGFQKTTAPERIMERDM